MKSYLYILTVLLLVMPINFIPPISINSTNSFYANSTTINSKNNTNSDSELLNGKGILPVLSKGEINNFQSQDAGITKVIITLTSSLGNEINYCSIVGFTLSWTIIPVINTEVTLYYMNSSYFISNSNYKFIIMNDPYNLKSFDVKFTLLVIDSNNNHFTKSTDIIFNPNYCGNETYPLLNTKSNTILFEGNRIPALSLIFSSGLIIAVTTIFVVYYYDHRKRTE